MARVAPGAILDQRFDMRACCQPILCAFGPAVALLLAFAAGAEPALPTREATPPTTPRELFNAGTRQLHDGKLREAEALLESALASQTESFQPPALYNLGHVRFGQGIEELKKGPATAAAMNRGQAAAQGGDAAIQSADDALRSMEVNQLVNAYLRGKGMRRELKAAATVVKRALQTHGAALNKWQRAAADFRSALELNPKDADAKANAEIVDRFIAKLIDSIRELQQMAQMLGQKEQKLGEKLKQIKGSIPEPNMPPGAAGDDDEEQDQPKGQEPGQKEGPSKEGEEMNLSPEQAGWLLEGFKLDNERRLPMGQNDTAEPKNRNRPTW